MKQKLLFLTTLLFAFFNYAQVANPPFDLLVCDNNQDGFVDFNLNNQDAQILSGQSTSEFSLTYHVTQADADTGNNAIVNTNSYTNNTNPQVIFARVVENSTQNYATTSFLLSVELAPNLSSNLYFQWCDPYGNFLPIGELEYQYSIIVDDSPSNYTFTYYETLEDANSDTNAIPDPFNYYYNFNNFLYVAAVSDVTGCRSVEEIFVEFYQPAIQNTDALEQCSTTGFATFSLEINQAINDPYGYNTITYHTNEADAYNNANALPLQYNNISNPQTIYIRLEDSNQNQNYNYNDCFIVQPLNLVVNSGNQVTANAIGNQEVCGSDLIYDLTQHIPAITGGETGITVSFFTSASNLAQNTNAIQNPDAITLNNFGNNTQYVRVDADNSNCFSTTQFNITAQQTQPLNGVALYNCGASVFDLQLAIDQITNSFDGNITIHETQEDALANANAILNINNYTATSNDQTLYSSALTTTQCYSIGSVNLIVEDNLTATNPTPLQVCDDDNDGFFPFDLTSKSLEILGDYSLYEFSVFYYETQEDAQNEINPVAYSSLASSSDIPYINTTANSQIIYVRVNSNNTDCFALTTLQLEVLNALIVLNPPTPLEACDENGDGILEFNLDSKIGEISQGLTDVEVTFYTTQYNAINNLSPISGINDTPGIIFVRVTNAAGCFAITALEQVVIECPIIVTCGSPVNTNYCYVDNDTTQYYFESDNGQPLVVVINAGEVELDWDQLIVLDSDGVTNLNPDYPYGNGGDVSGFTFVSTGSSITVYVNSDEIYNCGDQGYTSLDFDVFCADGIINVEAFRDTNNNSNFDVSEVNFNEGYFTYIKNNDGVINTVNTSTGQFTIITTNENDTYNIAFNLYTENENCYDVAIPQFQNVTASSGSSVSLQFPVVEQTACEDVAVALYNFSQSPRTGFDYSNYLYIENYGNNTVSSGSIEFVNDANITFLNANNIPAGWTLTTTATGFVLDFVNLYSNNSEQIEIILNVPTTANIGDLVTNVAMYTSATNDSDVSNNTTSLTEAVVNSYDPNDITESHGREIKYNNFTTTDEYLYYTIRFQNIGTADAINVNIENTLSPLLDHSTLRLLHSSHDVVMTETNGQLTFKHDNINLVSQTVNEEASKGFVYYKIKPAAGYNVGTIIPNTAEIYFDFNQAVVTNTFNTEFIEENLSVQEFTGNDFALYPNPATSNVTIKLKNVLSENASVEVIDLQGKVILTAVITDTLQLNIKNLESGLYFIKLKHRSKQTVRKLIIE